MSFKYFEVASHAKAYAKFRPSPPEALVERMTNFLRMRMQDKDGQFERAIDVGCGSGQSTAILSKYFKEVIGFDASEDIISEAMRNNKMANVSYRVAPAEEVDLEPNSVDLVTTCQAIHWFNLEKFYKNTKKLLKDNGVLAIYGYSLPQPQGQKGEELSQLIEHYYRDVLKGYILKESIKVYLDNYKNPEFNVVPFVENGKMTREESVFQEIEATPADLIGYITTWSGFQNYCRQTTDKTGEKILKQFHNDLSNILGPDCLNMPIKIRYNYFLLLGAKAKNN